MKPSCSLAPICSSLTSNVLKGTPRVAANNPSSGTLISLASQLLASAHRLQTSRSACDHYRGNSKPCKHTHTKAWAGVPLILEHDASSISPACLPGYPGPCQTPREIMALDQEASILTRLQTISNFHRISSKMNTRQKLASV